jgi:PIN domain nuclease of toxin-antitoxin system
VRLLLDTHVLLWALAGHAKVKRLTARLLDDDNQVFFSVASLWEVAIMANLGKLDADVVEVRRAARDSGFVELPVMGPHVEALMGLADHHRDPFDRLLVAQAAAEPMRLLTADAALAPYGVFVEVI